jgi:hypothetical protein
MIKEASEALAKLEMRSNSIYPILITIPYFHTPFAFVTPMEDYVQSYCFLVTLAFAFSRDSHCCAYCKHQFSFGIDSAVIILLS